MKSVRYVSEADELGRFELKPNYRALGPRFGKQMPQVAAAIAALDPARLRAGGRVGVNFNGQDHEIGPEDVTMVLQPLEGYQVERSGTHAVALNLELDDELRREGLAREVVHAVQAARKNAGLDVEDRIALTLGGRRGAARRRARARGLRGRRDARDVARVRRRARRAESAEIEGRELSISVRLRPHEAAAAVLRAAVLAPGRRRHRGAGGVRDPHRLRAGLERDPLLRAGGPDRDRGRLPRRASSTASADEGSCAALIGGLIFGSFILLGNEIMNNEPKAHLPDPQGGLVFVTALGGSDPRRARRALEEAPGAAARGRRGALGPGAGSSAGSSSCTSRFFGSAPMIWWATCPFLKSSSIGIDITLYCAAVCGLSSTFSFTMRRSSRSPGKLLEMRSDDPARAAPGRPEVDEDRLVGLEHLGLEVVVGDLVEIACHGCSLLRISEGRFRKYSDG